MPDARAITPDAVLPDGVDTTTANGVEVRKGTVAAFVANAKILASLPPSDPQYPAVRDQLRALVPAVRAVGVFDVFAPRTATLAALIDGEN